MPLPSAVGKVSGTSSEVGESHGAPPTFVPPAPAHPDVGRGFGGVDEPPAIAQPKGEPVLAGAEPRAPAGQQAPPASTEPDHAGNGGGKGRYGWYAALLIALIGGVVAVVVLASSSSTQTGKLSSSALARVPTNHVTGSGSATVRLNGDTAAFTVTTNGLDNGAALVHAMHIHAGGKGECPPASAARLHNGHLTISTTDGINYYGPPVLALTTTRRYQPGQHSDLSPLFDRRRAALFPHDHPARVCRCRHPPEQCRRRRARHRLRRHRHLQRGARTQRTQQELCLRRRPRRPCAVG